VRGESSKERNTRTVDNTPSLVVMARVVLVAKADSFLEYGIQSNFKISFSRGGRQVKLRTPVEQIKRRAEDRVEINALLDLNVVFFEAENQTHKQNPRCQHA
jgi:hypothetical protein